jgi:hypothetical protein
MKHTSLTHKASLRAALAALLIPLLFVAAFIIPTHNPTANHLPIAVVGPPAAARPLLRPLGDIKVIRVSSAAAAQHAVRHRTAYGAIVLGPHSTVDIASGESFVAATLLRQNAIRAGIAPTQIKDLAPLPAGDPRGTTLNLVALALLVGSILGATLIVVAMTGAGPWRPEAVLAGVALAAGAGTTCLLKAYSALPGPFAVEAALFAGFIFAISLFAAGLVRLRGPLGTSIAFFIFLVIANPASGLATARDLLPTPWRQYGPLMPPGAWGQAVRGTAYFGGAADLGPILVLVTWIALGAGLNVLGTRQARPAEPAPHAPTSSAVRPVAHDRPSVAALRPRRLPTSHLLRRRKAATRS